MTEELKDNVPRVPAIYSIDCTLNECGSILSSMGQVCCFDLEIFAAMFIEVIECDK